MSRHSAPEDPPVETQALIEKAVRHLWNGGLVAFPTETVYGIGANAANPKAVRGIFKAKGRPSEHPLIVHLPDAERMAQWAQDIPDAAWDLANAFWPGPMTMILKKQPWVPDEVTGGQDTVGLRVPNHPIALSLLQKFADFGRSGRGGIAAPSANRFGAISPTSAEDVLEELMDHVSIILDGGSCAVGIESTIVDLTRATPTILRPGAISRSQLEQALGSPVGNGATDSDSSAPRVPGSATSHYAPRTPTRLMSIEGILAYTDANPDKRCGILAYTLPPSMHPAHIWQMAPPAPEVYARTLYGTLRNLDHRYTDMILIEALPETAEWTAVRDRISRAAM